MSQTRIEKLREILREKNLDGFLVSNFFNILYLTGFKTLTEDEREAWVLITTKNVYLFTDSRYINLNLKSEVRNSKQIPNQNLKIKLITPDRGLIRHLQEIIEKEKISQIGFEGDDLKVNELDRFKEYINKAQFVSLEKLIIKIREIKDEEEINSLRTACKIADECLEDIIKIIRPGITEKEIAFKVEFWLKEKGHDLSFYPIVAIDKNSAVPHYDTRAGNNEKIKKNSIILIDYGAKFRNYNSDTTRIIFVGKPTNEMINIYNKLLEAQIKTIDRLKTDNNPVSVDQFCRAVLNSPQPLFPNSLIPNPYPHSTGHGVGLQIHEFPKISFTSTDILLPNQVVTIEPGVYLNGKWGMRIEDTLLIKERGKIEVLTKFSKEPLIIKD
jgi:Xaa-Pro aminopeptidase